MRNRLSHINKPKFQWIYLFLHFVQGVNKKGWYITYCYFLNPDNAIPIINVHLLYTSFCPSVCCRSFLKRKNLIILVQKVLSFHETYSYLFLDHVWAASKKYPGGHNWLQQKYSTHNSTSLLQYGKFKVLFSLMP